MEKRNGALKDAAIQVLGSAVAVGIAIYGANYFMNHSFSEAKKTLDTEGIQGLMKPKK